LQAFCNWDWLPTKLISSFLIALREGLEAALIIGIVLVYLGRTGRSQLVRFVWAGVGLAAALSLATSLALERWQINQEAFEGLMLLLSAIFVVTMIVWMNRAARHLRKQIEQRVESYADRAGWGAGLGLGTFVFLMVLREGAEMALILRAVELSSEGVGVWMGVILGLAGAIAVGLLSPVSMTMCSMPSRRSWFTVSRLTGLTASARAIIPMTRCWLPITTTDCPEAECRSSLL